jgi:hypothetical protein
LQDYGRLIATLTYTNIDRDADARPRLVRVVVADPSGLASAPVFVLVSLVLVNDPPVIDVNGPAVAGSTLLLSFLEDSGDTAVVGSAFAILDPEDDPLVSALVSLTGALDGSTERLAINTTAAAVLPVVFTQASTTAVLVQGEASIATYEQAIRAVLYRHTLEEPTPGPRQSEISVVAANGVIAAPARTILTVVARADPPRLDLDTRLPGNGAFATFTEQGAAVPLFLQVALVDPDTSAFHTVVVTFLAANADVEELVIIGPSHANRARARRTNTTSLELTFFSPAPASDVVGLLLSLFYVNTLDEPGPEPRGNV